MSYAGGSEYVPSNESMTKARNFLYGSPEGTQQQTTPFGMPVGPSTQVPATPGALYSQQPTNFHQSPLTYGQQPGLSTIGGRTSGMPGNNIQSYTPTLANYADNSNPIFANMLNQQNEASKMGAQTGMEMMADQLGRRGISGGGLAMMGGQNIADQVSRQLAQNQANTSMNQLGLQAQQQTQNQQAQNQGGMFNTQNAMNLGMFNQQQYALAQQLQAAQQNQQLQNLMQMYLGQLPSAATVQPGWGAPLMGGMTGLAQLGTAASKF